MSFPLIVNAANDISLSNLPSYPQDGQTYWVIFKEGYRNSRVEMSTCDITQDGGEPQILWDRSLTLQGAVMEGIVHQYYLSNEYAWTEMSPYGRFTDWATEVIASNLDIIDTDGNVVLKASDHYAVNNVFELTDPNEVKHTYQFFDWGMEWNEAKAYCESIGGHLATITSQQEQDIIKQLLEKAMRNSYWIGGFKDSGEWKWVTGEDFEYTEWATNQPDNNTYTSDDGEDSLMAYRNENPKARSWLGAWNDLYHDGTCGNEIFFGLSNFGFICEWEDLSGNDDETTANDNLMGQFNLDLYRADIYTTSGTVCNNSINYMLNATMPSQVIVNTLETGDIKDFRVLVDAWKASHWVTSPSKIAEGGIDEKGYYEAIILSIFVSQSKDKKFLYDTAKEIQAESNKIISIVKNGVKASDDIDLSMIKRNQIIQTLSINEQKAIADYLGKGFKDAHPLIDSAAFVSSDVLGNFFKVCDTLGEAIDLMAAYMKIADLSVESKAVLSEMSRVCSKSNPMLCSSLLEVCASMNDWQSGLLTATINAAGKELVDVAEMLIDEFWGHVVKSNPYVAAFMGGAKIGTIIGDAVTNTLFSTDATISSMKR